MNIWVSGTAGKLGSAVSERLRRAGHEVTGVDLRHDGPDRVDLLDFDAVLASMAGAEAVIHCAAIPSPAGTEPSALVQTNVMSTFNVMEAASRHGITRAVLASSGSIYGTAWSPEPIEPPYVPIDEDTPLLYVDPYALTKDVGERIGAMFARRGVVTVSLRFHWILAADELRRLRNTIDEEENTRNLWGYVELDDAARACELSLRADLGDEGHAAFVIAASDTLLSKPTEELLDRWLPGVERRRALPGTTGGYDCRRAAEVLGWRPAFGWG
jgi:UDP-glucose 4-epimerase